MSANVHHIHTNVRHRLVCQLLQVEAHSKVATSSNDGMPKVELESLLCRAYIINPAHVLCPAAPGAGQDKIAKEYKKVTYGAFLSDSSKKQAC